MRMKRDDNTEEGEKSDHSRSQLYLIVASVLVIIVMGFVLVRLLKKGPEPESATTSAPAPQAVAPPPVPKNEITSLDNAAPVAPVAPAKPKTTEVRPAPPVPAVPQAPPSAPAPGGAGLDGATVQRASALAPAKPTAPVKPKVKTAKVVRHIQPKPSHKKVVDVQAEKPRRAAEHLRAKASEPAKPAPVENSAETLSKKPDEGSFVSEPVRPPPEPFVPVTPSGTAAQSAAPEAQTEKQKPEAGAGSEEAKAQKPGFTLLVKTYKAEAEARDYVQELKKKGYKSFLFKKETTKFTWYNVMAGGFADREAADKAAEDFLGKEDVRAVVEPYPGQ